MAEHDWARAGREVQRRRRQLGWTNQVDAAKAAGIGVTNWREVEGGAGNKRSTSFTAIETALRWPPDMIDRIAAGEDPPEFTGDDRVSTLEARCESLTASVNELRSAVAVIQGALADWLRLGSRR